MESGERVCPTPGLRDVVARAERIARTREPILITGETGVGKEIAARHIHDCTPHLLGEFVRVNCAGSTPELFSDLLFGHRKGAFTGAVSDRRGLLRRAEGGTLFLDEIGDMPDTLQAEILHLLDGSEVYPLGGDRGYRFEGRLLAATNKDLEARCRAGEFRLDLLHRLSGGSAFRIDIPPLRDRPEDISVLAESFLRHQVGADSRWHLGETALRILTAHSWPGNVRELRKAVVSALVVCQEADLSDIGQVVGVEKDARHPPPDAEAALWEGLTDAQRKVMSRVLRLGQATQAQLARELELNERTVRRSVKVLLSAGMLERKGNGRYRYLTPIRTPDSDRPDPGPDPGRRMDGASNGAQ